MLKLCGATDVQYTPWPCSCTKIRTSNWGAICSPTWLLLIELMAFLQCWSSLILLFPFFSTLVTVSLVQYRTVEVDYNSFETTLYLDLLCIVPLSLLLTLLSLNSGGQVELYNTFQTMNQLSETKITLFSCWSAALRSTLVLMFTPSTETHCTRTYCDLFSNK